MAAVRHAADRGPPIPRASTGPLARPSLDRPYHPDYTHTNFRGWYEFGGGSIADMGHYSLWPIFQLLDLDSPISVESTPSHVCRFRTTSARGSKTITPFLPPVPFAFVSRRKASACLSISSGMTAALNRPFPMNSCLQNKELAEEGMLFVGDKGKVWAGFAAKAPGSFLEAHSGVSRTAIRLPEPSKPIGGRRAADRTATPRGPPHSKAARRVTAIFNWPGQSRI